MHALESTREASSGSDRGPPIGRKPHTRLAFQDFDPKRKSRSPVHQSEMVCSDTNQMCRSGQQEYVGVENEAFGRS